MSEHKQHAVFFLLGFIPPMAAQMFGAHWALLITVIGFLSYLVWKDDQRAAHRR